MHLLIDKIFNAVYKEVRYQLENQDEEIIFRKSRLKHKVAYIIQELIEKARPEDFVKIVMPPNHDEVYDKYLKIGRFTVQKEAAVKGNSPQPIREIDPNKPK